MAIERGTRSRKRFARRYEAGSGDELPHHKLVELESSDSGWSAAFLTRAGPAEVAARTVVLAAGGRCFAVAETQGELSTNHPNATGEVTRIAMNAGAEARDLDALQYHPNGGAWPSTMRVLLPETTRAYGAVLRNADGEEFTDSLRPRDAVLYHHRGRGREGQGCCHRPTGDRQSGSIRPRSRPRTPRFLPYMLRRYRGSASTRSPSRSTRIQSSTTRTVRLVIDEHAETTLEGVFACGEIAGGTHRKESHDGQLAPRVRRLSDVAPGQPHRPGARMSDAQPPRLGLQTRTLLRR